MTSNSGQACLNAKVKANNIITYQTEPNIANVGCFTTTTLYRNDKYYILITTEGCTNSSKITVYDIYGKVISRDESIVYSLKLNDNDDYKNYPITFVNNGIYYIKSESNRISYYIRDLNGNVKGNLIQKLDGVTNMQEE